MELEFLTIADNPHYKEMYLQHINEMINIELNERDTYNVLFDKLTKRFEDKPEKLQAVEDWINFNKVGQEDQSLFETIICENEECYAVFNLRK